MSRIFISHSSSNNEFALRTRDWLVAEGWGQPDDVFLDLDPDRGITAGERWKEALQKAAHRCEVVLALVSPQWLGSPWCRAEVDAARLMCKRIIVALIGADKASVPLDLSDEQWVDLVNDPDGFNRLKEGLKRSGVDPSTFPFPQGRRPYPGFEPLVEEDAAVYFGRDAQIVRGLDRMRGLVRTGVDRMLVILGASGAGKSSFMRAGLWPRLHRNDREWLPIMTMRPERAAIAGKFGLAQALERTIQEQRFTDAFARQGLPRARGSIQDLIESDPDGLARLFFALREVGRVPVLGSEVSLAPTVVLPIDQGEELLEEDAKAEAKRFLDILTRTLAIDRHVLVLFAIRSDAFPRLQADRHLAAISKDIFTLDPMLEGAWRDVIEGPARLANPKPLKVDPELTEALLQDVTGQDALPLLAFALEKLHETGAAEGSLSLSDYVRLNRIKGVLSGAVEQAFANGVAAGELPRDAKAQIELVRAAFIPHLARVSAAGEFVRRVATRAEIPPEARPIIDRLADHRLLTKDHRVFNSEQTETIEVAHESLLREWGSLAELLAEERDFLVAKGRLEQAAEEWQVAPPRQKGGFLLTGPKLSLAKQWSQTKASVLTPLEQQFISASADQEAAERRAPIVASGALYIIVLLLAWMLGGDVVGLTTGLTFLLLFAMLSAAVFAGASRLISSSKIVQSLLTKIISSVSRSRLSRNAAILFGLLACYLVIDTYYVELHQIACLAFNILCSETIWEALMRRLGIGNI